MEKFYGSEYASLKDVLDIVMDDLAGLGYAEHICGRIKSGESAVGKLKKRALQVDCQSAFDNLFDIIGVRTVVRFIDDVYKICDYISSKYEIITVKDYIKNPKENGYRSLHMIMRVPHENGMRHVEIQIRTISQDAWASLEHKMKYKKEIKHVQLIGQELKRCADEMASIDISMQAIDDMINGGLD